MGSLHLHATGVSMTKAAHQVRPASRSQVDEDELEIKAFEALGIMFKFQQMNGGPIHPRLTGAAIKKACWSGNEGFQVRRLMLQRGWIQVVRETSDGPGLDEVTLKGLAKATPCTMEDESLTNLVKDAITPPKKSRKPSRQKPARGYRIGTTPEDGSPIDSDELDY
jgi:hypothetical protein